MQKQKASGKRRTINDIVIRVMQGLCKMTTNTMGNGYNKYLYIVQFSDKTNSEKIHAPKRLYTLFTITCSSKMNEALITPVYAFINYFQQYSFKSTIKR